MIQDNYLNTFSQIKRMEYQRKVHIQRYRQNRFYPKSQAICKNSNMVIPNHNDLNTHKYYFYLKNNAYIPGNHIHIHTYLHNHCENQLLKT